VGGAKMSNYKQIFEETEPTRRHAAFVGMILAIQELNHLNEIEKVCQAWKEL